VEITSDLYVDPVMTRVRFVLPQSDVYKLDSELSVCGDRVQGTRAVTTGRVAEREVRSDEVGAVVVRVRRRHTTDVNHLRIYTDTAANPAGVVCGNPATGASLPFLA